MLADVFPTKAITLPAVGLIHNKLPVPSVLNACPAIPPEILTLALEFKLLIPVKDKLLAVTLPVVLTPLLITVLATVADVSTFAKLAPMFMYVFKLAIFYIMHQLVSQ